MELVRLNKYIAHRFGVSRREADNTIEQGRVTINGKVASLGNVVDPSRDKVMLDNEKVAATKRYTYLLMNKPVGYVCSKKQQGANPTIYSLLPRQYHHLKVAGRLDKDSCGLLLLTDDGDTIFQLTHPKFGKTKVYQVGLNKPLNTADKKKIESGVALEDGISKLQIARPKQEKLKSPNLKPNLYTITMHEGRNRQIRRTFKSLGYTVTHLERTHIQNSTLDLIPQKSFFLLTSLVL